MEAEIKGIKNDKVELLLKSKTIQVPKDRLKFDYEIGEKIDIHRMGDEFIFMKKTLDVPKSKRKVKKCQNSNTKRIVCGITTVIAVIAIVIALPLLIPDGNTQQVQETVESTNKHTEKASEPQSTTEEETREEDYTDSEVAMPDLNSTISRPDYSSYTHNTEYQPSTTPQNTSQPEEYHYTPATESIPQQPSVSCDDYHIMYYNEYIKEKNETMSYYNSSISSARNSCSSFGGCPAASSLERQRDTEIAKLHTQYKSNMMAVGCEPR